MSLIEIEGLSVDFGTHAMPLHAVAGVDLIIEAGDIVGIVGESGAGKTVSMLALMGLIPEPGKVSASRLTFEGTDLLGLSASARRRLVGRDMAMVFQEPTSSLNPCFTIGFQIDETLAAHTDLDRRARRRRTVELLTSVGIADPASRLGAFPHQLSGGMNQRVMIAMALACDPRLLIADEPTTALDVTIQAQILDLLLDQQRRRGMAMVLITHDIGVIAETVRRVVVMYAGTIVEEQAAEVLFTRPRHPYTAALLAALPERAQSGARRLPAIPETVPSLLERPSGCPFHPRCAHASGRCRTEEPLLVGEGGSRIRCHTPLAG